MPTSSALASRTEDRLASSSRQVRNVFGLVRCPRENEEEGRISPGGFAAPEALQQGGGPMPINSDLRHHYPPNWRESAAHIKFERTGRHCEWCGRPHGERVGVIKAGGWLDSETGERYDEQRRALGSCWPSDWPEGWFVKTILTCAYLDQNHTHNDPSNLMARCPRCTCATTGASASRAPTATSASDGRSEACSTDQNRYPNRSSTPSRISKSANSMISRPRPSAP